jgi:hypothetical protein
MVHVKEFEPNVLSDIKSSFLKVASCVVCLCEFPCNDIITSICKHLYHPWFALMHFKQSCKCVDLHCNAIVFPKWYKSFGFKEFDKELLEKEIFEGCENM